jgi:predicted MPP superfamily phosphohydrolase
MLDSSTARAPPGWVERRRALETGRYRATPLGRRGWWRKRLSNALLDTFGALLRFTPVHGLGLRNALDLRLVELELGFPHLPAAFDGYRILQLSDTHLDHLPELAPVARKLLDGVEADMLALTGDVQGTHRAPISLATRLLAEALEGARIAGPRLAVLGNHDPSDMVEALHGLGFEVLLNRSIVLDRSGARLHLTGLDDVNSFYTEAALQALRAPAAEPDAFRIALVHSAEMADHAAAAGYALYLCGHTHGGQICLPGGQPILTHLTRCQKAASGQWRWGEMTGYTNRGLGVSGPPLRFNCRGEAALFILRRTTLMQR